MQALVALDQPTIRWPMGRRNKSDGDINGMEELNRLAEGLVHRHKAGDGDISLIQTG
jgi:hypothetical protein